MLRNEQPVNSNTSVNVEIFIWLTGDNDLHVMTALRFYSVIYLNHLRFIYYDTTIRPFGVKHLTRMNKYAGETFDVRNKNSFSGQPFGIFLSCHCCGGIIQVGSSWNLFRRI